MEAHQKIVDTYSYCDEDGNLLYEVVRIEPGSNGRKKDFKQRRVLPDGTYAWGLTKDTRRVLWRLPDVIKAHEVFLCAGEKDAKTAIKMGLCATTNSGGEGTKWVDEEGNVTDFAKALEGKHVVMFADNDPTGQEHIGDVAAALEGIVQSFAAVTFPSTHNGRPVKDLTDYILAGGTPEEINRMIEIAKLPENAPVKRLRELVRKRGNMIAQESERLLLGAVLSGKVQFSDIQYLSVTDLQIAKHKRIYQAMLELEEIVGDCSTQQVIDLLTAQGALEDVGVAYLCELVEDLPTAYNIDSHIETVQRKASGKRLLDELMRAGEGLVVGENLDTVRTYVQSAVEKSSAYEVNTTASELDPASKIIGDFGSFFAPKTQGIMCEPIDFMLECCYGFHPGQLVVIGGRPSSGKSSLATLIGAYAARNDYETDIISLEIGKEECLLKIICMVARVPYLAVCSGNVTPAQMSRLQRAAAKLSSKPLYIDDKADWSVPRMRNHLKRKRNRGKATRLLIIDYLQLMHTGRQDGRRDLELGAITRGLKLLAKEEELTIILLSQLSRDLDKNNREPRLSDLRDSGSIEADADIVIFTHQMMDQDTPDAWERNAKLILAKQRNGTIGTFDCKFAKVFSLFFGSGFQAPNYQELLAA